MTNDTTSKPRKATIQRLDFNNWKIVAVSPDGTETMMDTALPAWGQHTGTVLFPLRAWSALFQVTFAGYMEGAETLTIPVTKLSEFNDAQHRLGLQLREEARGIAENIKAESACAAKATAEATARLANAECEDCHKRFYIPGIEDLPEGIELRHTEGHEDCDSYPTIISDGEKARREQAEKDRKQAEFDAMHVTQQIHLPPGLSMILTGPRKHVDAVIAHLGREDFKLP